MKKFNFLSVQGILVLAALCIANFCNAQLNGVYTIDATKPASSTNYSTFTSAVTDLDSGKRYDGGTANGPGVGGPVVFNISSSVYNEAITIASTSGASSKNTITFQSKNGDSSQVILENANNVITIGNAKYYTFKGITVQADSGGGYPVYANNSSSDHITFSHCIIRGYNNFSVYSYCPNSPNDHFIITNCALHGGNATYGIYDIGPSSSPFEHSIFTNNIIDSVYYNGIDAENIDSLKITNNSITNTLTNSNLGYTAINVNNPIDSFYITRNKDIMPNQNAFELYDVSDSAWGIVANNFFASLGSSSGDYKTAMHIYGNFNNVNIVFNNLNVSNSNYGSYGFLVEISGAGNNFLNNNIVNTGGRPAASFITTTPFNSIDYNNYYVPSTSSTLCMLNGTSYSTLTAWKSGSGHDSNSISVNPGYVSDSDLHATNRQVAGKGINYNGVNSDIDGKTRPNPPTIGANELNGISKPLGDTLRGIVKTSTGSPLKNQWVYELVYNASDSLLSAADSVKTDTSGNYVFYTKDSAVYLVAAPDSASYPNELETYYDSSFTVQSAALVNPKIGGTKVVNFNTLAGTNTSGGGFIGGKITICYCKKLGKGQPVPNLRVILVDSKNNPVRETRTDANGNFSFGSLGAGVFKVWIDYPKLDNILAPVISLPASNTVKENLLFLLYPTYLQLDSVTTSIEQAGSAQTGFTLYPNPTNSILNIESGTSLIQSITISDAMGKEVFQSKNMKTQNQSIPVSSFPAGIYFVKLGLDNGSYISKFIRE